MEDVSKFSIKTQVTEPPEISMVSDDPYLSQLVTRKTSVQEPQSFSLGPMRISMQAFVQEIRAFDPADTIYLEKLSEMVEKHCKPIIMQVLRKHGKINFGKRGLEERKGKRKF